MLTCPLRQANAPDKNRPMVDFEAAQGVSVEGPGRHLFTDIIVYADLRQIYATRKIIQFYVLEDKHLFLTAFPSY